MNRNFSTSPFLRLPPEIRVRIYSLVLDLEFLWITYGINRYCSEGFTREQIERYHAAGKTRRTRGQPKHDGITYHKWGKFSVNRSPQWEAHLPLDIILEYKLHVDILRVCRQIYTETALLPYQLNKFIFSDEDERRLFEHCARPGNYKVQKKAVGEYSMAG